MRLVRDNRLQVVVLSFVIMAACAEADERAPATGPSIEIADPGPLHIEVGDVHTVKATLTGSTSGFTYTSSDPDIASVDGKAGLVQALKPGNTIITVTAASSSDIHRDVQISVVPRGMGRQPMTRAAMVAMTMNQVCKNEGSKLRQTSTGVEDIHEYHDCQRLIIGNDYQSVVGIFAHQNVGKYLRQEYKQGRLVAVIVNYKDKPYEPLGIQIGTNCLVLKWNVPIIGQSRWVAALVPKSGSGEEFGECPDDMKWSDVPDEYKDVLEVRPQVDAADHEGGDEVPPVARWDWDPENEVNYMGVRCGRTTWCEIGKKDFVSMPGLTVGSGNKKLFKGYYDQQYLADEEGNRSDVWATVRPGRAAILGQIQRNKDWHEIAELILEAPTGSTAFEFYRDKLNLNTSTLGGRITGKGSMAIYSESKNDPEIGKNWRLQVNGKSVADGIMTHRGHGQASHRAKSVRWRWHEEDETVWSFCPEDGCCEMAGLL